MARGEGESDATAPPSERPERVAGRRVRPRLAATLRPRPGALAATFAVAALGGAVLVGAALQEDRAAAPATAWLGLVASGAFGGLLLAVRRARLQVAAAMVLALVAVLYLPRAEGTPLAAIALLLVAALAIVAGELAQRPSPALSAWLGVACATQLIVRGDLLWLAPGSFATYSTLIGPPLLAAVALAVIARRGGAALSAVAGVAAAAAGPGFTPWSAGALALVSLVALRWPAVLPLAPVATAAAAFGHEPAWAAASLVGFAAASGVAAGSAARGARGALAAVALGALLAAATPWQRAAPVAAFLRALAQPPPRAVEAPLAEGDRTLSSDASAATWPLSGRPLRALVIDSFLIDAVDLPCGTPVARVRLLAAGRDPVERWLLVGAGAGEWASARSDVVSRLACRALEPHRLWQPAAGRFFGRTFRTRLVLEPAVSAERIEVERARTLPAGVQLHLQRVAGE